MLCLITFVLGVSHHTQAQIALQKRNVLFIIVDDLRPELGCYGASHIITPNIDRLASRGVRFTHAYAQQAVCAPSRNSFFSGARPDSTKVGGGGAFFRDALPEIVALPQHFKNYGYYTQAFGKILHHNGQDDPISWSTPRYWPEGGIYVHPDNANVRILMDTSQQKAIPLTERTDVDDDAYADGMVAREAIRAMRNVRDRPFFLAVGFFKPHTPFNAPARYWDLYDESNIALASNPFVPTGAPPMAMYDSTYVRSFIGMPREGVFPDETARHLKHAYYACVSYIDAQVGRLLNELQRLALTDRTIVVFFADHGYQLGEHTMWGKHTNFETSTRVPLIVSVPGMSAAGQSTSGFVELVDLYPTLAELCSLPLPQHLEGMSFMPLLMQPDRPWKPAAFSQFRRGGAIGHSIRTDRYRYNEWRSLRNGQIVARELYDHQSDPDENRNIAADSSAELIERLSAQLEAGWRAARPGNR